MLKLLIVDDENYTREGILEMLSWDILGISEVRQAFDGVNALEIMKDYTPNIILTDIKMPRMDGIELAINVRDTFPDCAIIFMSSYSDKKYLKSAIQLKAINYVEKPLDLEELSTSISNAALEILKLRSIKVNLENTIALQLVNINDSITIKNLLANCFTKSYIDILNNSFIVNVVVKFFTVFPENENMVIDSIKNLCTLHNYNSLITLKDDSEFVIHLFINKMNNSIVNYDNIYLLLLRISEYLDNFSKHYIAFGNSVESLDMINLSYNQARKGIDKCFYYEYNSIIYPVLEDKNIKTGYTLSYKDFDELLKKKDKNTLFMYTQKIFKEFKIVDKYSISFIKDIYYNLTLKLINISKNNNLESSYKSDNILKDILSYNNIYELNKYLWDKICWYFDTLETPNDLSNPIQIVIKFINENFADPNLSLDEISKHTFLTSSYICVLFKDYMGTTVNKYINELRIERAKLLLSNAEIKMKDIALKVGYSDGNYFAKIFKKETGYNPSDYRRSFSK